MNQRLKMKRQRSGRTTLQQYHRMLDFFLVEKGLAEGKFVALHGKEESHKKWQELAKVLNGYENGAQKTPEQWQVVWRDLKSRTVIKARTIRDLQIKNQYLSQPELSDLDKRVIGLIHSGHASYMGYTVPNAIENNQDENDSQNEEEANETPEYSTQYIPVFNEAIVDEVIKQEEETLEPTFSSNLPSYSTDNRRSIPSSSINRITVKRKRENPDEYLKMARQYMSIAKRQADAMMMFAKAEKNHAEAAKINAQALNKLSVGLEKLGDTARAQVENNRQQFELLQNMTKVLQSFAPNFVKERTIFEQENSVLPIL